MSLDYTLYVKWDGSPSVFLALLFPGATVQPVRHATGQDVFRIEWPGLTATASRLTQMDLSIAHEELEIEPTVNVLLRVDKFDDPLETKTAVLDATLRFLRQHTGDAALLFNGEVVILTRKQGRVTLNEDAGFWNYEELVKAIDFAYEKRSFPIL